MHSSTTRGGESPEALVSATEPLLIFDCQFIDDPCEDSAGYADAAIAPLVHGHGAHQIDDTPLPAPKIGHYIPPLLKKAGRKNHRV